MVKVRLAGTTAAPHASARVAVLRQGSGLVLLLAARGLPAFLGGPVDHLWLLRAGQRRSGGTFTVGSDGRGTLIGPLTGGQRFNALGVTLQPDARARRPRRPKVLGAAAPG